ncbi:MAG: response regulator, partial [Deltaproteobacteria bacterium]|nr:response regulator [Deltaproteobacteria bacterium]
MTTNALLSVRGRAMSHTVRLLIADSNEESRHQVSTMLSPLAYELEMTGDGEQALSVIHNQCPDLVLLTLGLPSLSGYELIRRIKQQPTTQFLPLIAMTSREDVEGRLKAIEFGADDVLTKPLNRPELVGRIKSLLRMKFLHDDLDTSENILISLAAALEAKDASTHGHSERVATLAMSLARTLSINGREMETLRKGALLHDIGKIAIRESVLLKQEKLTDEEMAHIREHPARGFEICKPLKSLEPCLSIIRSHHERYDGSGYPDGLAGEKIPLCARITAVADAFDAMTCNRPYR